MARSPLLLVALPLLAAAATGAPAWPLPAPEAARPLGRAQHADPPRPPAPPAPLPRPPRCDPAPAPPTS